MEDEDTIYENCVNRENEDPLEIIQRQIDTSLDLLSIAKSIEDHKWESELKRRLAVMSKRRSKIKPNQTGR